jgi:hypothetical protein
LNELGLRKEAEVCFEAVLWMNSSDVFPFILELISMGCKTSVNKMLKPSANVLDPPQKPKIQL